MATTAQQGQYIELSDGKVHFDVSGPNSGRPVVFVHGFSTPYFGWDPTFHALANAGFRVLRYDLYGRGGSGAPRKKYSIEFFDRQLNELVETLGVPKPFDLVGWSMGAMVVATYCAQRKNNVRRVVLIAPAGFPMKLSSMSFVLKIPVLGDLLFAVVGRRMLLDGVPENFHEPERFPEYYDQFVEQFPNKRAILSTMRNVHLGNHVATYKELGKQRRHIKLIWGRADRVTPFKNAEQALDTMPNATLLAVDRSGHGPHYEHPAIVNAELTRFLAGT